MTSAPARIEHGADRAKESRWTELAARAGLASRGVVYLLIAVLALAVALGKGGREADRQGALQAIADKPGGRLLLIIMAVGFAGYALWRLLQAVTGPDDGESRTSSSDGDDRKSQAKNAAKRAGALGKGLLYASFTVTTLSLLAGGGGGKGEGKQIPLTARLLRLPAGRAIVTVVGLVVIGGGLAIAWRGAKTKFEKHLDLAAMSSRVRSLGTALGSVGLVARGIVFAIAGTFLVKAAFQADAHQAKGLDGTLRAVADHPYGKVLLALAAAGLAAYGAYSFVEARYRKL